MGEAKRRRDQMGDDYWKGKMPIEVKFAMLADHVSETKEGKLVIVGVFDAINAPEAPTVHPQFFVVARFETSVAAGTQHELQLGMWDEDGQALMPLSDPFPIAFAPQGPGRPLRAQFIIQLGMQFPKFGDYEFRIVFNGRQLVAIPLRLNQVGIQK